MKVLTKAKLRYDNQVNVFGCFLGAHETPCLKDTLRTLDIKFLPKFMHSMHLKLKY